MPFFDVDNQRLYFCSDMVGGYGGWDIYCCNLNKSGWGKPELLSEEVNTVFDEIFPSIFKGSLFIKPGDIIVIPVQGKQ